MRGRPRALLARAAVAHGAVDAIQAWLERLGPASYAIFVGITVLGTATIVPSGLLCAVGGLVFGWLGLPLGIAGALIGGLISFTLARRLSRERLAGVTARYPLLGALDTSLSEQGWRVIMLLRLTPVLPFYVGSYFFGATRVRPAAFLIGTLFGVLPSATLYTYVGTLGQTTLHGVGAGALVLPAIGIVCGVVAVVLVGRGARASLMHGVAAQPAGGSSA